MSRSKSRSSSCPKTDTNAGVPRSTAMKLTGHKTEAIYRRYAIVSKADLDLAVGKLAAHHEAQRQPPASSKVISLKSSLGRAQAQQKPKAAAGE
jgi:hypothetical protein